MTTSDTAQGTPSTEPTAVQDGAPAVQQGMPPNVATAGAAPVLARRGQRQSDPRLIPSHQLSADQVQQLSQMGDDVPGTWNRAMQDKYGAEEAELRQIVTEQSASDAQQAAVVEASVAQFRTRKLAEERGDLPHDSGPPPTETVPGGAFLIGGQWVDANGQLTDAPPPRRAPKLPADAFQEHPSPVPGQAPQSYAQQASR